jgi:hypothetical protein
MNTITNTASTTTILASDLGKYKSVACVHDQGTGECAFVTFEKKKGSGVFSRHFPPLKDSRPLFLPRGQGRP